MNLVRLKNHVSLIKGKTCQIEKSGKPYLSLSYIRGGELTEYTNRGVWVNEGDLLIVNAGGNSGEIIKAKDGFLPATLSKIKFNKNKIDTEYLFYSLKKHENKFKFLSKTSNFHFQFNVEYFLDTHITLPSVENQIKIAQEISLKSNKIQDSLLEINKQIVLLKSYENSYFKDFISKQNTKKVRLKNISKIKSSLLPKESAEGVDLKAITAKNIENGEIIGFDSLKISKKDCNSLNFSKKDDIIISIVGENCGKVGIVNENLIPSQSLLTIRSQYWFSIYVHFNYIKTDWREHLKGSSIQSINGKIVKNEGISIFNCNKVKGKIENKMNKFKEIKKELIIQERKMKELQQKIWESI